MKISEADEKLEVILNQLYDAKEAANIQKIFWTDIFNYKGGINRTLHTQEIAVFNEAIEKLAKNFPIQYVTGVAYFYDLKLFVDENVLIPRPETEELVHLFLNETRFEKKLKVLDVGTGSGCIPIIIKNKRSDYTCVAIDISKAALAVAQNNAERHELKIDFRVCDFLDASAWSSFENFDAIISNPPYIGQDEKTKMTSSTLLFEPYQALFPEDDDVLIFYKKVADFGLQKLNEGGMIFLECNEFNAQEVKEIFQRKGYVSIDIIRDMQEKDRMILASKAS